SSSAFGQATSATVNDARAIPPTISSDAWCSSASAHAASISGRSSAESTATSTLAITVAESLPPRPTPAEALLWRNGSACGPGMGRIASGLPGDEPDPALRDPDDAVLTPRGTQAGRRPGARHLGLEGGA